MRRFPGLSVDVFDAGTARLSLRCGASVLALAVVANAAPAFAQAPAPQAAAEQPADDAQIVVTGIKQSLKTSQAIKRNADTIVDSVTAEDIGALPDRSVTETLQRIPGVSINRFAAGVDPDHFSVEGSGVVVRGLTYVRSEFNSREAFSANNGRSLSFADVPAELLAGVDVFKSPSADRVEGGIAGVVNLRTRLPFDSKGLVVAGTIQNNYSDFIKKSAPTFSVLASDRWETGIGEIGILGSFSYSQLFSRSDKLQISNFGPRTYYAANGDVLPPNAAATGTAVQFPRGAVMGTQEFDRQRYGYSAALQWRSNDRSMEATFQFLRSDSREAWTEHTIEIATDNVAANGDSRAVAGTRLNFDSTGLFDNGFITGPTGWRADQQLGVGNGNNARTPILGLQSNNIRRDVKQKYLTDDYSGNFKWDISDRLALNLDFQHVKSSVTNLDVGIWGSTYQNAFIDLNGTGLPVVEFRPPQVCNGPAANDPSCAGPAGSPNSPSYFGAGHTSFTDPYNTFYRAAMDHAEQSDGTSDTVRLDLDYKLPENNWIKSIQVGGRYSDRDQVARFSTYNWGVLSEQWGNSGPVWLSDRVGGAPTDRTDGTPLAGYEPYFFPNFFAGQAANPLGAGGGRLFSARNGAEDYAGYIAYNNSIVNEWKAGPQTLGGGGWASLGARDGVVPGTLFLPSEINPVREKNKAAYVMARFDHRFGNNWSLTGNIGVRYTSTERVSNGFQVFTQQGFSTEAQCAQPVVPPATASPFCGLSLATRNAARAFANGAATPSPARLTYDYWLPSFNARLDVGGGLQFRAAYFKGIAPPDFGLIRNYYNIGLGTNQVDLDSNSGRPLGRGTVGNPLLRPTTSDNFDLTAEWYFSNNVGKITASAFYKELRDVVTNGTQRLSFTNNGATFDALVTTPINSPDKGKIKGFELSYEQVYDFLPGFLSGLGLSANYTYVESKGVKQSTLSATDPDVAAGRTSTVDTSLLPLQGLSKHTVNISPFYQKGALEIRAAYSWRSKFVLTVRDVIVPFQPIINEATGQLDGSIFLTVNKNLKLGVQGVNLLNEITKTSAVLDNTLRTAPRGFYINDRRFTAVARLNF